MNEWFDNGELGEFWQDYALTEELADQFYEPESYKEDIEEDVSDNTAFYECISQFHYA